MHDLPNFSRVWMDGDALDEFETDRGRLCASAL